MGIHMSAKPGYDRGCIDLEERVRAELIYNPSAGGVVVRRELTAVLEYLQCSGWAVDAHETRAPREATALARQAVSRGVDVVVAVGGDGTVNEVACALAHTGVALGVLPVGTTNVWALQMNIPALKPVGASSVLARWVADLEERMDQLLPLSYYRTVLLNAARVLVQGNTRTVDMGMVGDRHFLMWAGIGLDAAVTENVSIQDKKALGPLAFVGSALDTASEYKSSRVTLTLDGQIKELYTPFIVVSNIQLYGGIFPLGAHACVDDGKLDVCVFKGQGLFTFVHHALKVVSRQHLRDPEFEYYQSKELIVESTSPLPVHVDDEPFTQTPVVIRVVPRALKVIVPFDAPQEIFSDSHS